MKKNGDKNIKDTEEEIEEVVIEPEKEDEAAELTKQNAELNDRLLRQMAEFDNYRKRTEAEKTATYKDATADCATAFLGMVDNFERALEVETTDEIYKKGVQMIFDQLMTTLKNLGVTEIEALHKEFDPNLHCAVNKVEDESLPSNTVSEVFQKGYILGDKVIQYAMVVVAN